MSDTRQVKWNETSQGWEEIFPEDKGYEDSVTQFWTKCWADNESDGAWVTVPEN